MLIFTSRKVWASERPIHSSETTKPATVLGQGKRPSRRATRQSIGRGRNRAFLRPCLQLFPPPVWEARSCPCRKKDAVQRAGGHPPPRPKSQSLFRILRMRSQRNLGNQLEHLRRHGKPHGIRWHRAAQTAAQV